MLVHFIPFKVLLLSFIRSLSHLDCFLKIKVYLYRLILKNNVSLLFILQLEVPAVVVGVVGIGHVPGIEKNWEKHLDINEIMRYVCLV